MREGLRVEFDESIATITLARPERLNALTVDMLTAIEQAAHAVATSDARAVVLTGEGTSFTSGMDLDTFRSGPLIGADPERRYDAAAQGGRAADAFAAIPQVSIAALCGHVVGGGVVLASVCDIRIADRTTQFSIPEVEVGIPLAWGGIRRLVGEIGPARTKDLVLTGRRLGADEALSWGLITRLVDTGEALETAYRLGRVVAGKARFPITTTKRHIAEIVAGDDSRDDALGLLAAIEDPESAARREEYLDTFASGDRPGA